MGNDYTMSPAKYKLQLDKKSNKLINKLYKQKIDAVNRYQKKRFKVKGNSPRDILFDILKVLRVFIIILVISLVIMCIRDVFSDLSDIVSYGLRWLSFAVPISIILGSFKHYQNYSVDLMIKKYNKKYDAQIEKIKDENNKKYEVYCQKFDEMSKQQSIQYDQSPMLERVIQRAQIQLIQLLKNADRRPHVEIVEVKFPIVIRTENISIGTNDVFDFKIECCNNIDSYYEQAGLGNALAKKLCLFLMMTATENGSISPKTDVNFDYQMNEVFINLTYTERNPAFVKAQSF